MASHTHKFLLLANYILIGAATSCIFLAISLRLIPSLVTVLLIFLHLLTIILSISSPSCSSSESPKWHAAHMAAAVLISNIQGAVALLAWSTTDEFLGKMKSYVREEDGVVILRMMGGLGLLVFVLEWVVVVSTFYIRFYVYGEMQQDQEMIRKDWSPPFQV